MYEILNRIDIKGFMYPECSVKKNSSDEIL